MSKTERELLEDMRAQVARAKRAINDLIAENSRLKGENATLIEACDKVKDVNGALCEEVNEKDRRIRELEALVRELWKGHVCDPCTMIAECPAKARWNGGECKMEKRVFDALRIEVE